MKKYNEYLIEKEILFLYENDTIQVLDEARVQPEVVRWAYQIAKTLGLKFDMNDKNGGFLDTHIENIPSDYKNTAFFTDPITNTKMVVKLQDHVDALNTAWRNLVNIRYKAGKEEPPKPTELSMEY